MEALDQLRRIFSSVRYEEEAADSRLPPPSPLNLRRLRGGLPLVGLPLATVGSKGQAPADLSTNPGPGSGGTQTISAGFGRSPA